MAPSSESFAQQAEFLKKRPRFETAATDGVRERRLCLETDGAAVDDCLDGERLPLVTGPEEIDRIPLPVPVPAFEPGFVMRRVGAAENRACRKPCRKPPDELVARFAARLHPGDAGAVPGPVGSVPGQTVAGADHDGQFDFDEPALRRPDDPADRLGFAAGLFGGVPFLRRRSTEKTLVKRAAEHLRKGGGVFCARCFTVENPAVCRDDAVDVIRPFHAPLDLERGDTRPGELGHGFEQPQVAWAEKPVAGLPLAGRIGFPAGLGACAAVAGTGSESGAPEAAPRDAVAHRAVDECLDLEGNAARQFPDLFERGLARQDDACDSEAPKKIETARAAPCSLRAQMTRDCAAAPGQKRCHAEVLDDQRIRLENFVVVERLFEKMLFVVEDDGI
ncbi:MAG: hypothetical protein BWY66_01230 [bacterium ADurb.Bin374]|nr:MAG: hypothetical protein BWY66_01230 [bacterium ADurb.Bin374]